MVSILSDCALENCHVQTHAADDRCIDQGAGDPAEYKWTIGTRLVVEETADGILLRRAPLFPPTSPETVFKMLAYSGEPKSLEDMEAGVMAEAARRHAGD